MDKVKFVEDSFLKISSDTICFTRNYSNPKIANSLISLARQFHLSTQIITLFTATIAIVSTISRNNSKNNSELNYLFIYLFTKPKNRQ